MSDSKQKKEKEEWSFNTFAWADEQKLPGFGKLLNSWLQVHKNYCNGCRPENSWENDFKEWSQVGFLSNAGVLVGGIALEEWGIEKKSASGDGRNDLFLRLPTLNSTQDYFIEAKLGNIDLLQSQSNWAEKLSEVMGNAIKGAEQLDDPNLFKSLPTKAVAISFFTLSFDGVDTSNLDEKTSALHNCIQAKQRVQLGLDALASIYFSAEDFQQNRKERNGNWNEDNELVGLILVAKHIELA